ncbi:MAG TPA: HlyD family efflux transporter periplasmic adaptor subunit [Planctomycetaceae bacterium]|nr:HlyD family efflux transporter periplasmic adaptor subunit [Planctomycetaceae bacterium]
MATTEASFEPSKLSLPWADLARSSRRMHRAALWLLVALLVSLAACVFAPWQQSVAGTGRVITYDPNRRLQEIDAPISGRLTEIKQGLVEGTHVNAGEVLMKIEVIDPFLKDRLTDQFEATKRKLEAEGKIVFAYEQQVEAFIEVLNQTQLAQDAFVKVAEQKLLAEEESLKAAEAGYDQAEKDRIRRKELFEKKVESRFEWELAERKAAEMQAKVAQSKAYVAAAQSELAAKNAERNYKMREAQAKVDSAKAVYEKSKGDREGTLKEYADIEAKQVLQVQPVIAPLDGFVLKIRSFQGGQIVSAGQPLVELVPSTADQAVEIKVDGNDAPLVATLDAAGQHRKVRLQFEGWPAVQFSGWPSVAVGTFGGIVATVDRSDDGQGKFRVLVVPDPNDRPWPEADFLRQGARVNGWVLLNQVPLGMELWRQLNGFPPVITTEPSSKGDSLLRKKK